MPENQRAEWVATSKGRTRSPWIGELSNLQGSPQRSLDGLACAMPTGSLLSSLFQGRPGEKDLGMFATTYRPMSCRPVSLTPYGAGTAPCSRLGLLHPSPAPTKRHVSPTRCSATTHLVQVGLHVPHSPPDPAPTQGASDAVQLATSPELRASESEVLGEEPEKRSSKIPPIALVSVIVPVYNVAEYLPACVHALVKQSYTKIEILLIDDGSTDTSGRLCDEYARSDPRVTVIHTPNRGLSAARNAGLDLAKGDYVCFVDSDDWVSPRFVELLVTTLERHTADIAVCTFVEESDRKSQPRRLSQPHFQLGFPDALYALYGPDYLVLTVVWNKLYKRGLFDIIRFPVGLVHEDEEIMLRLFDSAPIIVCFDQPLYHYRQRDGSITQAGLSSRSMHKVIAYENRLEYLQQHNHDPELLILTRRRLIRILLTLHAQAQSHICALAESSLSLELVERLREHVRYHPSRTSPLLAWAIFTIHFPRLAAHCYSRYLTLKGRGRNIALLRRIKSRTARGHRST